MAWAKAPSSPGWRQNDTRAAFTPRALCQSRKLFFGTDTGWIPCRKAALPHLQRRLQVGRLTSAVPPRFRVPTAAANGSLNGACRFASVYGVRLLYHSFPVQTTQPPGFSYREKVGLCLVNLHNNRNLSKKDTISFLQFFSVSSHEALFPMGSRYSDSPPRQVPLRKTGCCPRRTFKFPCPVSPEFRPGLTSRHYKGIR